MAQMCSVSGCRTEIKRGQDPGQFKLYRFPRDACLLEKWKTALKIDCIRTQYRICNTHFTDSDYMLTNLGWKVLMPTAVPTLNLPDRDYEPHEVSIKVDPDGGSDNCVGNFKKSNDSCGSRSTGSDTAEESNPLNLSIDEKSYSSSDSDGSTTSDGNDKKNSLEKLECLHCNKKFSSRLVLLLHLSAHYDLNSYTCFQCEEKFESQSKLSEHKRRCPDKHLQDHPKEKLTAKEICLPFYCGQCASTFSCRSQLEHHKSSIPHSRLRCILCDTVMSSRPALRRHVASFHLASRHICTICERLFGTFEEWTSHFDQHGHAYECPECCEQFKGLVELDAHLICHKSMFFYACNYCVLLFSSIDAIEAHKKVTKHKHAVSQCNFCKRGCPPGGVYRFYHEHQLFRGRTKPPRISQEETKTKKQCINESPRPALEIKIELTDNASDEDLNDFTSIQTKSHINCGSSSHTLSKEEILENELRNCTASGTKYHKRLEGPKDPIKNVGKCEDCNFTGSHSEMILHQDLHKSRGDFSCIECGTQCHSSMALAEHYRGHVKVEPDDS